MQGYYLIAFGTAFLVALISTPLVMRIALKIGAVDVPNKRKVHESIMPRLGGLAVFLGFIVAALLIFNGSAKVIALLLGCFVILIVGILDDIFDIPPRFKLAGQVLAASIVVVAGIRINFVNSPFNGYLHFGIFAVPITMVWIVAVTNAVNLIDGLDGLASGVSAIALLTFALIAYQFNQSIVSLLSIAMVGAILGFLRYNFYPAKIFLGDSGSMLLGFTIATLAVFGLLKGVTILTFIIPTIILGVPIFDTLFAIVRRYLQAAPIFQADKKHIHHRLLGCGLSHKQVVLVIYGISLCFSFSALYLVQILPFF